MDSEGFCVYEILDEQFEHPYSGNKYPTMFRPIKTQQEIEREKAIEDMKSLCKYKGSWESTFKAFAEDLIDAGYHK